MLVLAILPFLLLALLSGCGDDDGQADNEPDAGETDGEVDASCQDLCSPENSQTCDATGNGVLVCRRASDGCLSRVHEPCPAGDECHGDECVPCTGTAGTFHQQSITSQGEDRFFYLHVPSGYTCVEPWPVLVDLHGSAGYELPEEAYCLHCATSTADASSFILVRPRSRSSMEGSDEVFRWDQNPGDPERNRIFLNELMVHLSRLYNLDTDRIYLMGFSSGTNQTTVAQSDEETPFKGFGYVGGGVWTIHDLPSTSARLYLTTGYRDYMWLYHNELMELVYEAQIPSEQIMFRQTDAGHELYAWMYPEMWAFLDQGIRPGPSALRTGWSVETTPTQSSLLALISLPSGDLMAFGEGGAALLRDGNTSQWSEVQMGGTPAFGGRAFTSACITANGQGIVVGGGNVALSADEGQTWTHRNYIPEHGGPMLGFSFMNGVGCGQSRIVAIGYWAGAFSDDNGQSFSDVEFDAGGYRAQGASIKGSAQGTWMAVGYFGYIARSTDGQTFTMSSFWPFTDWILDVTAIGSGIWVAVGEEGNIWRSDNDGISFSSVKTQGSDLYAVSFLDGFMGLAVGLFGSAFLTEDGGATWTDVSSGFNGFLGDVLWLSDGTAIVVGEAGTALRFDPQAL